MTQIYLWCKALFISSLFLFIAHSGKANIFLVTNTNAAGAGSLSDAIFNANYTHPGRDTINFNIPGGGPFIIKPGVNGFTAIEDALFINGYSQPGSVPGSFAMRTILIVLDGGGLPPYLSGLYLTSGNVEIAGLNIRNFGESGIIIGGNLQNIHVWGSFIGTNETGTAAAFNGRNGIATAPLISDSCRNITIGTNGDGVNDEWEGNVISGNRDNGIAFHLVRNSVIAGNYIGVGVNGTEAIGNATAGIVLNERSKNNIIGTNADGVSDSFETNVIGNNSLYGIWLYNSSDSNTVAGNRVGINVSNNAAPNTMGIIVWNASHNVIGVTTHLSQANIIGSNAKYGIKLQAGDYFAVLGGATTQQNRISGNFIGTYPPGIAARGNGIFGVYAESLSGYDVINNVVGSNNDGSNDILEGNVIAFNQQSGVSTYTGFAGTGKLTGLSISKNRMYGNVELGIDLKTDLTAGRGVSPNHNTPLTGPNNFVNAPVLTNILESGDNFIINGFSDAGATIELFKADGKHPSNPLPAGFTKSFGEGIVFYFRLKEGGILDGYNDNNNTVGTYDRIVEGNNNPNMINANRFSFTIPKVLFPGLTTITGLTATATDADGNTSEFSGVVMPPIDAPLPVDFISFKGVYSNGKVTLLWATENETDNSHFDVERSNDGRTFAALGSVAASHNSSGNYSYIDAAPLSNNFYRLKQVDINGDFKYSKIISLNTKAIRILVSPNPFVDHLNVSYQLETEGAVEVFIYDVIGRLIKKHSLKGIKGYNFQSISDLNQLPSGQYFIRLIGDNVHEQVKIVK